MSGTYSGTSYNSAVCIPNTSFYNLGVGTKPHGSNPGTTFTIGGNATITGTLTVGSIGAATANVISRTANMSNGSNTITSLSSTTDLYPGMPVSGPSGSSLGGGVKIGTVVSGSSVTLVDTSTGAARNASCSSSCNGGTFTFGGGGSNLLRTGTRTASSDMISITSTDLLVGMSITGNGIPSGTTIIDVPDGSSIQISQNASSSGSTTFTFGGNSTSRTGTIGSGTPTQISALATTNDIFNGMNVSGPGIPVNTTVTNINSGSTITMSASATAFGSNVPVTFTRPDVLTTYCGSSGSGYCSTGSSSLSVGRLNITAGGRFYGNGSTITITGSNYTNTGSQYCGVGYADCPPMYFDTTTGSTFNTQGTNIVYSGCDMTIPATTYYQLQFTPPTSGGCGGVPSYTFDTGTVVGTGDFSFGGSNPVTIDAATNNTNFTMTGNFTLPSNATFQKGSGQFTFSGGGTQVVNVTSTSISRSTTTTSSSPTLTLGSTTGILKGMSVVGTGIPADTIISSIDSGTEITLSANATASGTSIVTFNLNNLGSVVVSSGTLQLGSNDMIADEVTVASGQTLDLNGRTLTVGDLVSGASATPLVVPSGASLNGSVKFISHCETPPCTITIPTAHYKGLTLAPSGDPTYQLGNSLHDHVVVDGDFTLGDGENDLTVDAATNDPDIELVSHLVVHDKVTYQKGTIGKLKLNKGTAQTWTDDNTVKQNMGHVQVSDDGAGHNTSVTLGSDVSAEDVTIDASQSLDLTGYTLTLSGNSTPLVNNGTFTVSTTSAPDENGDVVVTGSTIEFASASATGTTVPALHYHHLKLNKASNAFTVAAGTLLVDGNLEVTAGTLNLNANDPTTTISGNTIITGTLDAPSSGTLTIGGSFTNNGTFNNNNGTVAIVPVIGTTDINIDGGSNSSFYNFTASDAGIANKNIKIKAGNTLNISHNFTLAGSPDNGSIILGSDSINSPWTIYVDPGATVSLAYIVVRDSTCGEGTHTFSSSQTVLNGGNNGTCWSFISRKIVFPGTEGESGGGTPHSGGGHGHSGSNNVVCTDAAGTATLDGSVVASVSIDNQGTCYTGAPSVFFCGGGGSGATGTATVSGGHVTGVDVTNAGSNYSGAPTLIIAQPDGSGGGCPSTGGGHGGGGGGGGASAIGAVNELTPGNTNWFTGIWNWLFH